MHHLGPADDGLRHTDFLRKSKRFHVHFRKELWAREFPGPEQIRRRSFSGAGPRQARLDGHRGWRGSSPWRDRWHCRRLASRGGGLTLRCCRLGICVGSRRADSRTGSRRGVSGLGRLRLGRLRWLGLGRLGRLRLLLVVVLEDDADVPPTGDGHRLRLRGVQGVPLTLTGSLLSAFPLSDPWRCTPHAHRESAR